MKKGFFLLLTMGIFTFCSEEQVSLDPECVYGEIVGQKCNVFALQLGSEGLGATDWPRKDLLTGEIEGAFPNVIGLVDLPEEFSVVGKKLYLSIEELEDDYVVPCWADMPPPPSPYFNVLFASESGCKDAS